MLSEFSVKVAEIDYIMKFFNSRDELIYTLLFLSEYFYTHTHTKHSLNDENLHIYFICVLHVNDLVALCNPVVLICLIQISPVVRKVLNINTFRYMWKPVAEIGSIIVMYISNNLFPLLKSFMAMESIRWCRWWWMTIVSHYLHGF